jgi:RNA polymerase sigma-70 factor (ECF subfamily)
MNLDDRDRAIVLLREVEGLPYDEIAAALGLKMGTLKATLHRAREKLRHALIRAEVTP